MKITILTFILFLFSYQVYGQEPLDAKALIQGYLKTEQATHTCRMKVEEYKEARYSWISTPSISRDKTELSLDGDLINCRINRWYNLKSEDQTIAPIDASRKIVLWNGKNLYEYTQSAGEHYGEVFIDYSVEQSKQMRSIDFAGAPLIGIFRGDLERVGDILTNAKKMSVQSRRDTQNSYPTYTVEADTKNGHYTVWIAPNHGYNIVKAVVNKGKTDLAWGKPLGRKGLRSDLVLESFLFMMDNVVLEKVDDLWVPKQMKTSHLFKYTSGKTIEVDSSLTCTSIDIHPQFVLEKDFAPDFPDDTEVDVRGGGSFKMLWKDVRLSSKQEFKPEDNTLLFLVRPGERP